jgi:ribosomal protein S18 acetylase RimI-like enzyme
MTAFEANQVVGHPIFTEDIGFLYSIGVHEDFRGRGIATKLVELRLDWLLNQNIGSCFTTAWQEGTRINIEPVISKFGFKKIWEMKNYFAGENCPRCGDDCKCSAFVFLGKSQKVEVFG